MFPGLTILYTMTLKGDIIRHYLWWKRKCYLWVSIKTPNHHQSWLQFPLSHHTLQHTNSKTNPFTCPDKWNTSTNRCLVYYWNTCRGGGGGGGGGGGTPIFSHICRLRPFWGFKIFFFQYIFGFHVCTYIYENMRVPPPTHTHTHTQTLGILVRLSALGFGARRICACADPDFHFFRLLISQRAHMLRSLTSFFFSNGKL